MQRGRDAQCVPGTGRMVVRAAHGDAMLGRNAGEGRRHADGFAVGVEEKHPLGAQAREGFAYRLALTAQAGGDVIRRGWRPGLGGRSVDRQLDGGVEVHHAVRSIERRYKYLE